MPDRKSVPIFVSQSLIEREWVWAVVGILVVLLAEFVGLDTFIRFGGERLLRPLLLVSTQVVRSVAWPITQYQTLVTTQRRILDLEYRYAEASAQLGEMNALKAENQALREMLTASDVTLQNRVITQPIVSYGRPLVAGGGQDGVQVGAMVLVAQTLVGRVTGVSEHQAEVTLLSQISSSPVLAKTESGIDGIVRGDDKRVLLTEVPINVELRVGERVVTQGQAGIAPNIFIGRVASIISKPESAAQVAVIEQLVSFYEATVVEIR